MRKRLIVAFLISACWVWPAEDRPRLRPVPKLDQNVKTGPAAGSKIPDFEAVDQNGNRQNFASLRGTKGLLLLFYRSADW